MNKKIMEKPILFNTEMVKAILQGRKVQTRRIIKQKYENADIEFFTNKYGTRLVEMQNDVSAPVYDSITRTTKHKMKACEEIKNPYNVGDILYIRETWAIQSMSNSDKRIKFMYKAIGNKDLEIRYVNTDRYEELLKYESKNGWNPSLFMPKEAARIFLKITDIRAERIQEITEEGSFKEGITLEDLPEGASNYKAKDRFEYLWDSIYKSWKENPWVWVIEFARVEG